MRTQQIPIEKYEAVIENGSIVYYAISGKKRYPMPDCYKEMYNDNYLMIEERVIERPELFDTTRTHYIPLRTGSA